MPNLNKVMLMGNLTRDPEIKYTPKGTAIAEFGLAVNRNYKDADGAWQEETEWFRVVVFGQQAERAADDEAPFSERTNTEDPRAVGLIKASACTETNRSAFTRRAFCTRWCNGMK